MMRSIVLLLVVAGCGQPNDVIRIGHKGFTEQRVLAHALAGILRDGGSEVEVAACGDTLACQQALRAGSIDAMFEYTGTGMQFLGGLGGDLAAAKKAYAPLGVTWVAGPGFDNGYKLVVTASSGWATISDLRGDTSGLRIAIPPDFARRPGDGLAALVSRYGLTLAGDPRLVEASADRLSLVTAGRVDVAVMYATDGVLTGAPVQTLRDDLTFFPPYSAEVMVNTASAERFPALLTAPHLLKMSAEAMQRRNYAVDVSGRTPARVASELLVDMGLVETVESPASERVVIGFRVEDDIEFSKRAALKAATATWPARSVEAQAVDDPAGAVAGGKTRLAVVGAERLFDAGGARRDVEAIAVVGRRFVQLIRPSGSGFEGRIGVEPPESGDGVVGAAALGRQPAMTATTEELLKAVASGALDGAIVVEPEPVVGAVSLPGTPTRPYLRQAVLATATGDVACWSVQTVLIGPSRILAAERRARGPNGDTEGPAPLSWKEVRALGAASGVAEAPDPRLPSAWTLRGAALPNDRTNHHEGVADTVLNLLVLLFLGWLVRSVLARPLREGSEPGQT